MELYGKQTMNNNSSISDPNHLINYPPAEDIFKKSTREVNVEPEDPVLKILGDNNADSTDLDVPGADLDDAEEVVGSEDEENNYYSIGGDEHNALDESGE